ncbi:hypothetical protein DW074_16850 [Ruminococcus sp. AF46-10NS]|nr:hypothetical protein [Ruminococcus sp. AF46-10NS]RHK19952.1 hypothetical protein DW074_16850 [Ruminococcus sp. AF46-10NS]
MDTKIYTDEQKLSIMYEGDKARDATDKIRGFLFQDFVTIMCLLQKNVKYVCSEYIEDVDVFFEDNTFEFIQNTLRMWMCFSRTIHLNLFK